VSDTATDAAPRSSRLARWSSDVVAVLPAWIAARLIVALGFLVADAVIEHHALVPRPTPRIQALLAWDGAFYRSIAEGGYANIAGEPLRFFPLYPWTARMLAPVLGGREDWAVVVVANVAALVAAALLRRLVIEERGDVALADWAGGLVSIVPPAFALVFAYSEALFLAFAVGCFLGLRRGHWWLVAACAFLAALTRPVGVVLAVPIAVEVWTQRDQVREWGAAHWAGILAALAAPVAGLCTFLAYTAIRFDTWTEPIRAQRDFRGDVVDPISRLARGVGDLFGDETFGDGLHLPFAVLAIALVVLGARRWPARYTAFSAVLVVLSLSADNLNSLERYGLNALPLVLVVAVVAVRWRLAEAAITASAGLFVALTTLAFLGRYVP
jgi:hypothetical protein